MNIHLAFLETDRPEASHTALLEGREAGTPGRKQPALLCLGLLNAYEGSLLGILHVPALPGLPPSALEECIPVSFHGVFIPAVPPTRALDCLPMRREVFLNILIKPMSLSQASQVTDI